MLFIRNLDSTEMTERAGFAIFLVISIIDPLLNPPLQNANDQ